MKTILTTLALLAVFATPSFAQAFCTCDGTGSVLTNNPISRQSSTVASRQAGLDAFAMVPGRGPDINLAGPAATGGGSVGYNEMLRNY